MLDAGPALADPGLPGLPELPERWEQAARVERHGEMASARASRTHPPSAPHAGMARAHAQDEIRGPGDVRSAPPRPALLLLHAPLARFSRLQQAG